MIKPNRIKAEATAELEQSITSGLKYEWGQVISILPVQMQSQIKMPIFQFNNMKKWAAWSPALRTITFSKDFVYRFQWQDIISVLRHEMAHQIAHELLNGRNEKPHGPIFHKACELIDADPKASDTYSPLCRTDLEKSDSENDKIRLKIQKLLSLAQSPHQAEAEAACTKANELLLKYNLKHVKNKTPRTYISRFITKSRLRHSRDIHLLAGLLSEFFFVECVWAMQWVVEKNKPGRVLEISGIRTNLETAHYAFDFIVNYINLEWKRYIKQKRPAGRRKIDFAIGVIEGFRSKLKNERAQFRNAYQMDAKALTAATSDPFLSQYLKKKYKSLVTKQMGSRMIDRDTYDTGHKLGKGLIINEGITQKSETHGKMLPNRLSE